MEDDARHLARHLDAADGMIPMAEVTAIVENGQIRLPAGVQLPDGLQVRIVWDDSMREQKPYERTPLTEEDVRADLVWATGKRFQP